MYPNCATCYDSNIDLLIYQTKFTLNKASDNIVKSKLYGYSCDKNSEDKTKILTNLLRILESENSNIQFGGIPCLTSFKKQSLAEKIRQLTTSCDIDSRKDLIVDESNEPQWIANNPYCVSRESWEKLAYTVCRTFKLELQREEDNCNNCDLRLDILNEQEYCNLTFELTRNLISCDLIVAIQTHKQMCDLNFKINRTEKECKLDFDILVNEHKCNLDFKTYKTLIDCNLSFDIIKTVYESGCSFEYSGGEILIASAMNTYPLSKLQFDGQINPVEIKKLKLNTAKSKYMVNPQQFIEKLKSDYGK